MNELLFVAALITMLQGGKVAGTATGFFYLKNDTIYLVTNRHVVINETKGLKADALRIRLHTNSQDLTKNVDRELPLYQNGKQKWYVHKDYPKVPIDIAVIELSQEQIKDVQIKALSQTTFFLIHCSSARGRTLWSWDSPEACQTRSTIFLSFVTHSFQVRIV